MEPSHGRFRLQRTFYVLEKIMVKINFSQEDMRRENFEPASASSNGWC